MIENDEQALALANGVPRRLIRALQFGTVWINDHAMVHW